VQTQDTAGVPRTFVMPIELDFYGAGGESKQARIQNRARSQEFQIPLAFRPQWVDFDPSDVIEKELSFAQPLDALIAKSRRDPAAMSRLSAVADLAQIQGSGVGAAVTALTHALNHDPFYAVRAAAASSLAQLHTESAKAALLKAIAQPDSRVRVAVVKGLASFTRNPSVYRALTAALSNDQSFAVQASAAVGLGSDGDLGAFRVLSQVAVSTDEVHVMQGVFEGLITTGDLRAFPILLTDARPGVPERLRLEALKALAGARGFAPAAEMSAVAAAVRGALRDPTLFIRQAGEALAGSYGLTAFAGQIETIARTAPTQFERAAASAALQQLRVHSTASPTVSSAPDTRSGR